MNNMVASLADRILKHLSSYTKFSATSNGAARDIESIQLRPDEVALGIYENFPGTVDDAIVVTNLGLHLRVDTNWQFLGYNQIETIETPANKQDVTGLQIHLNNLETIWIPVRGGRDRFHDAFEFLRFLQRVRVLQSTPSSTVIVGSR